MTGPIERTIGWLQDAGYALDPSGEGLRATHPELPAFLLRDLGPGVLFSVYFKTEGERGELLEFVNVLNREARSSRFLIDGEGDFAMESWLPAGGDSETFRVFLEAWFESWDLLVGSPDADRYLR